MVAGESWREVLQSGQTMRQGARPDIVQHLRDGALEPGDVTLARQRLELAQCASDRRSVASGKRFRHRRSLRVDAAGEEIGPKRADALDVAVLNRGFAARHEVLEEELGMRKGGELPREELELRKP